MLWLSVLHWTIMLVIWASGFCESGIWFTLFRVEFSSFASPTVYKQAPHLTGSIKPLLTTPTGGRATQPSGDCCSTSWHKLDKLPTYPGSLHSSQCNCLRSSHKPEPTAPQLEVLQWLLSCSELNRKSKNDWQGTHSHPCIFCPLKVVLSDRLSIVLSYLLLPILSLYPDWVFFLPHYHLITHFYRSACYFHRHEISLAWKWELCSFCS